MRKRSNIVYMCTIVGEHEEIGTHAHVAYLVQLTLNIMAVILVIFVTIKQYS